jgi:hypothetical protein
MPTKRRFPLAAGRQHSGDPQQDEIWRQIRQIIDYLGDRQIPGVGGELLISLGNGSIGLVAPGAANTVLTSNGKAWKAQAPVVGSTLTPAGLTGDIQIKASATTLGNVSPGAANTLLMSNGTAWLAGMPGADHGVLVRLSGACSSVAPGGANTVLLSNGTDWAAGVPGANGSVIVNASGALAGVAPSTSGNVLTSNGSAWVSSAPANPGAGVWTLLWDLDFTSLGLSTAVGNGNFTINGQTWTVGNFANSSVMSVGGADGLRIKCKNVSSTMTIGGNTAPYFMSPSLATLLSGILPDDVRIGIRMSFYTKAFNRGTASDITYFILSDSTFDGVRFEVGQFNNTGSQSDYMRLILNSSTKVNQTISATLTSPATHDCMQFELGQLGIDIPNIIMTGISSGGALPSKWYRRAQLSAAAGAFFDTKIKELADARISIAQSAPGTAGTSEIKIGRMKLEYYRYQ